jgi:sodium transport system ATP-binding protein
MSEAEEVCDRVAVLHRGELVALDSVPAILAQTGERNLERAFFALVRAREEGVGHAV